MAELKAKEDASRIDIEQRFAKQRQVVNLNQQLKKFQQEHQELERQWTARKEIQQDVKIHQLLHYYPFQRILKFLLFTYSM